MSTAKSEPITRADIESAVAVVGDRVEWLEPIRFAGYFYRVVHWCGKRMPVALGEKPNTVEMSGGTVEMGKERVNVYVGRCPKCNTTFVGVRD